MALCAGVILVAGCGGGGGTTGETTGTAGGTTTTASSTATPTGPAPVQKLPVPREFKLDKNTPEFFSRLLGYERPIFLWFYSNYDSVSQQVKVDIEELESNPDYSSVIFRKVNIDKLGKWANLAGQLQVGYVPHLFVFDRGGLITSDMSGFIDAKTMENAVYDAVNYRHTPAKEGAAPSGGLQPITPAP